MNGAPNPDPRSLSDALAADPWAAPAGDAAPTGGWTGGSAHTRGRRVDLEMGDAAALSEASLRAVGVIQAGLQSPGCTEIHGIGPDRLFTRFHGEARKLDAAFASETEYNLFIKQMVDEAEAIYDWADIKKMRRAVLRMADGSSLTIVLPPFAPTTTFSIRRNVSRDWTLDELVERGSFTPEMVTFLRQAVRARANILFVGQMGSGKTSALSLLTREFDETDRVVIVEEIPEIKVHVPQVVYYTYQPLSPGLGLPDILDSVLYQRADRVIVGEVHMEGLTKMLEVGMLGQGGTMSTYHSGSVEQAIERMRIGLQLENPQMSDATALAMIRNSLELVVVLERQGSQHRCVEIGEVDWRQSAGGGSVARNLIYSFDHASGTWKANRPDPDGRLMQRARKLDIALPAELFLSPGR